MKKITFIFLLAVLALFIITCKKYPELKIYDLRFEDENIEYSANSAEIRVLYSYPTTLEYVNAILSQSNYFGLSTIVRAEIQDSIFIVNLVDLQEDTKYYYKFEYSNGVNVVSSDVRSFTIEASHITLPTVATKSVTGISATGAKCGGNITSDGGSAVTVRGVCWSTKEKPTIYNFCTDDGTGSGSYISSLTGLTENTTYYVRAYAKNEHGTSYGNEVSFVASGSGGGGELPTVTTGQVTNITSTSAKCSGIVNTDGGSAVTTRGVCWSTEHDPVISDSHTTNGNGVGVFNAEMTELTSNTTYYVRAYATNENGTAYGDERTFATQAGMPTVTTKSVTGITSTTASCGGVVTNDGGGAVTARGVCWSTTQNPTINGQHSSDGTGTGEFTSSITGLSDNITYYVRAYATNSEGTSYGDQKMFITSAASNTPTVTTDEVSNISSNMAMCGGNVTSDGGATVIAKGVCWSTSQNPTATDSHTNDGTGTGGFTSVMTGLTENTTYYVRAYATNSEGTSYGSQKTFTTTGGSNLPTVSTNNIANITATSALGGGIVISEGSGTVTAKGVCWSTSQNPTVNNSHTTDGTGSGAFLSNITGLLPNTTYFVRAYATNGIGTAYGDEIAFTTADGQSWPNGVLPGVFSVSATKQVHFSIGNLRYIGNTTTPYWQFAEQQWEYLGGYNNGQQSDEDKDLFCWGTSGYNHGAVLYQPWTITGNASTDFHAYGHEDYSLYDSTGKADWGYNAIINGGNQENQWRTLTHVEWDYLLNQRTTPSNKRFAKAQVNGVNGIIIIPDNWVTANYPINDVNSGDSQYTSNIIDADTWLETLEYYGLVFLPAAGERHGTNSVSNEGSNGCYWSSSVHYVAGQAYQLWFHGSGSGISSMWVESKLSGYSVRLVKDVE